MPAEEQEKSKEVYASNSWRVATYASIVIIVGLVIFNVVSRNQITSDPELYGKSMAVLPFINNSPDAENAYFSNGTMEAIHSHLCKIKDLRVISRTSVEAYRNKPIPIPSIAEEKQVSYVLEGSMQKYGNKLRLTVTLFDSNDRNLWSKLYNTEITQIEDLLTLQSDIAQMVAAEIEAVITPEEKFRIEKVPTRSLMAYDFYQRGLEEQNNAGRASQKKEFLEKAKEYYHLAIDNDVTFAKAYSGLASIYWQQQFWLQYFSENSMDSVLILADLALTYDNTLAEAYTLKGRYFNHIGDTSRALEELNKAILLKLLEAELRGIFDPYIILMVLAYPAAELRGMRERDSIQTIGRHI